MLHYVTGIQRLCVQEDVFWYAFWNTDADGDRLLIKECIIGWHEVSVAFGANQNDTEEFRAMKINNKNFSQYRPGEFLPETVETNAARKLVNGQPYEETSYYKEAAPYGATYYLMNIVAELFWCNGRKTCMHSGEHEGDSYHLGSGFHALTLCKSGDKEGEIDLSRLLAKFPSPISELKIIRDHCRLTD
ncbi:hypothetical protein R1sor_007447 [Riccia sorocarpa]|uniref:Uncharacterized protein n=1 Tax=Riccia sorocarpa TaxID=122646 RepID=A0ABD3HS68_9MARC